MVFWQVIEVFFFFNSKIYVQIWNSIPKFTCRFGLQFQILRVNMELDSKIYG